MPAETSRVMTAVLCALCGKPASERVEQVRRVVDPATGRDLGWARQLVAFRHPVGECVIPVAPVFDPEPPPYRIARTPAMKWSYRIAPAWWWWLKRETRWRLLMTSWRLEDARGWLRTRAW